MNEDQVQPGNYVYVQINDAILPMLDLVLKKLNHQLGQVMMMPKNAERYWVFLVMLMNSLQVNAVMVYDEVKEQDNADPHELIVDQSSVVVAVNNGHVDYQNYIDRRFVVVVDQVSSMMMVTVDHHNVDQDVDYVTMIDPLVDEQVIDSSRRKIGKN